MPPLDRPGVYLVLASPQEDFALADHRIDNRIDNRIEGLSFVLGDLVLAVRDRAPEEGIDVLALSGATGEPVAGAAVRLFLRPGNPSGGSPREETAMSATSSADGSVHFAVAAGDGAGYFLLATKGEDVAMVTGQNHWSAEKSGEVRSTLLYTDRAVYRPQQKILWKAVAYMGRPREGRFATAAGEAVTVTLYDPNRQKVAEQTVATNERGTASGELLIPPGHPLGGWQLESRGEGDGSQKGGASVQVEEYKRPTFETSLDEPAAPLRLNRPAQLKGRAVYYFGLPVTRGAVRWRVTREPYFPPGWWRRGGNWPRSGVIATGTVSLSPEGTFEVAFTPQGDERLGAEVTYGFTITAEVTDEGGETRSAETRVRLGLVSLEARIADDPAFLRAGRKASLAIVRSDLNGVPRSGAGAWSLYELRQPERALLPAEQPQLLEDGYHTPGDALSPRWNGETGPERILAGWSEVRKVASGTLRHGASGQADVPLPALRPGAYRLRYETLDDFGRRVEARRELIVAGRRTPLALPAVLAIETPTVRVGGTARLLVHSGLPGQVLFFEIDRDGGPIEKRMLRAGTDPSLIEIPIRAADRGGLGFRLLVLRDHQILDLAASVQVPWDDRELKVRFATFRDTIRPGARETWRVTVEDATAPVAAAELLASMTDRSLDAFAGYSPPSPLSLYP
ncbi:MAG TPA: MG2 domain-containing protein, partial [Thermoanaerobaculia bacterium]